MTTGFEDGRRIRALVVDDSSTIRRLIRRTLRDDHRVEVVGEASDPYAAREAVKALAPDVLTLDVEMPGMDGLAFLERLMRLRPVPTVMISSRTTEDSETAIRALALGAHDCVDLRRVIEGRASLADMLFTAAHAPVRVCARAEPPPAADFAWNGSIVLVGSSTGGVEALTTLLSRMPANCPPILVAQHMPATFLRSLARRLDRNVAPRVRLAADGDPPRQGVVLIAPGGNHHLELAGRASPRCVLRPDDGALHVPLIDRLFESAVPHAGRIAAVILTGMGRDGSRGLLSLKRAGARTLAQDGATSVVDGMPRAARELGAAEDVCALDEIGERILELTADAPAA